MKQVLTTLILLVIILSGCDKNEKKLSHNLRLRYKGADMPLWIRGNNSSDRIVLFLHGGPGGCSMCLRRYFLEAEEQLVMAYWDQRMAGSSNGSGETSQLNYVQFADDLKQVVLLLKQQYPSKRLFLLGHSFGVEMAWQFLTTDNNQSLVSGFIAMDGTYSTYEWLLSVQNWAKDRALVKGDQEAYNYMNNISLTKQNISEVVKWEEWYEKMFRLDANPIWPSDDKGYTSELWFKSPHSQFSQNLNSTLYEDYYKKEIFTFDRKDLLRSVTIPVFIFWGEKDGIMPVSHAYETSSLLPGNPSPILFKNSWHSPFQTDQDLFTQELLKATR